MRITNLNTTSGEHLQVGRLIAEVDAKTPGDSRLNMCIQCGTCGGSCPSGADMAYSPRHIFAMLRAGYREDVLMSNTPWMCVSCYFCTVRCPQEVHITDIMYTLKNMAIQEGYARTKTAPDLSQTFVDYVEEYGRSFELGLATRHYLKHRPGSMSGTAKLGLGMLSKGRIDMTPHQIDGIDQLRAILQKAREIEEAVP